MFSLNAVLLVAVVFFVLYLPRALCWFASLWEQPYIINTKKNRIALIIPARNEGKAVLPLLESIKNQTYDKNFFDVFIIVKEYSDPVIGWGREAGATVYVDPDQKCKGDCLDFAFRSIIKNFPKKYDGFMIVDADCVLKPTYMEEMNNAMASGADVINAKKIVGNYYLNGGKNSNLVTACNGLIWTIMDDMGNRWKSDHGFTTMTITTGILIAAHLVEQWNGWIYKKTLTEDMELERACSLNDYKTFYYSHAQLYMEESPSLAETNKRRSRWMNGLTHSDFIYAGGMLSKFNIHSAIDNYFMFCLWLVYLFIASNICIAAINVVCFALAVAFRGMIFLSLLAVGGIAIFSIYFAFFLLTLSALIVSRNDMNINLADKVKILFYHPVFYMGYIPIEVHAIFDRKPMVWDEIERVEESGNTQTIR